TITIQPGVGTPTTINVLSFREDGTMLAAGKDFGRVVVWDVVNRKFMGAVETGQGIVRAVAIAPDGQTLATGGGDGKFSLALWSLPDCKPIKSYDSFHGWIHSLEFGPAGEWLVVSDNSGTTQVIEPGSGKLLLELKEAHSPVLSLDGAVLLTANATEFTFWKTSDWSKLRTLPRAPKFAFPLALDVQGDSFLVAAGAEFRLARATTGELLPDAPSLPLPKFNIAAGGFGAIDGGVPDLVFGHSDARLWAWNRRTGRTCVSEVLYSEAGVLSPDGRMLAGARDNSFFAQDKSPDGVLLWDTARIAEACRLGSAP
ncbi:MAG TPA: WD40 repeat domain-containing protein, partial [Candidatus Acidoferrales bacterium]|nr:WD40 repeat domain-containing protein [Candidatus Acidoferrales bacterium]